MEDVILKSTTSLDFYVPDVNGSHLSQLNPICIGMLLSMGNLQALVKLEILLERYSTPFYGVHQLTGELYARKVTSMTLLVQRATIMPMTIPKVSANEGHIIRNSPRLSVPP